MTIHSNAAITSIDELDKEIARLTKEVTVHEKKMIDSVQQLERDFLPMLTGHLFCNHQIPGSKNQSSEKSGWLQATKNVFIHMLIDKAIDRLAEVPAAIGKKIFYR
jgi:hypothetical protein